MDLLDLLDQGDPEAVLSMAEVLLDVLALQGMGVRLVLVVPENQVEYLLDQAAELELKSAWVKSAKTDVERDLVRNVLERGQVAILGQIEAVPLSQEIEQLALSLLATKIMVFLNGPGVLLDGVPVPAMLESQVHELEGKEGLTGRSLLLRATEVCRAGVRRVHLLDGRVQGVLVEELFSNEGVGTMIHTDAYQEIRELREEDIAELLAMVGRSMRTSRLVPREYEEVKRKINDYLVMTVDGNVVGCVALHEYPEEHVGEVACLFVKQSHGGRYYGRTLVKAVEQRAQEKELKRVFALTNGAEGFFSEELGYQRMEIGNLPQKRQKQLQQSGRQSLAFSKPLE